MAEARTYANRAEATSLALKAGKTIQASGIEVAIKAWDHLCSRIPVEEQVATLRTAAELRDRVQDCLIPLLVKHDARHAELLRDLEELFGKFPEPVAAAS